VAVPSSANELAEGQREIVARAIHRNLILKAVFI
jgi:hypothetical protein